MNSRIDPRNDIEAIILDIWNIRTATTWGLDNWGRILDISRFFTTDAGDVFVLEDERYRRLLMLKAAGNISNCSLADLNRLLQNLYLGRGDAYVLEIAPMVIRYVFTFDLEAWEVALMRQEGIIPRPSGVGFQILFYDPYTAFGFRTEDPQAWQPFNVGTFANIEYAF
jgi:hypothetical protein